MTQSCVPKTVFLIGEFDSAKLATLTAGFSFADLDDDQAFRQTELKSNKKNV